MKRANGATVGDRGQDTGEKETPAGILGPPPRLPDPAKDWDELVEEAAVAEYLAKERHEEGEPVGGDG